MRALCLCRYVWAGGPSSFILDEAPGEILHQYSCTDEYWVEKQAQCKEMLHVNMCIMIYGM